MNRALFIKPFLLSLISFILLFPAISQEVPSKMRLGDLQLEINESTRRQIQKDVDRLTQSQTYFNILVDRMNLYFPIIEREHRELGIPDEIKFLAIQESALISDAVSSANAVGYWQFKDFTAREVGLRVDRNVDERLNIVAASQGSAKYLKSHNYFLKNWVYSVMAYNTGRGGAQKYINPSYTDANRMPINQKTHWYVKKFIAHVVAFTPEVGKPHSEGIWLDEVRNVGGKTLEQIAREEKVSIEEIEKYNKWLKRGSVPRDKEYTVLVPRKGAPPRRAIAKNTGTSRSKISQPEVKVYPTELKPGITKENRTTVIPLNGIPSILSKPGDDIHRLSARSGLSEKRFMKYNDLSEGDRIIANEFYYIKRKKGKAKLGFHVAERGETLWDVSQQYGIRLNTLAKRNRMEVSDPLKAGRVLWMDKTRPNDEPVEYHEIIPPTITRPKPKPPTVDDVVITKEEIEEPQDEHLIEEVPDIIVPTVDTKEERLSKVKIHTVAKGETLFSISRLYEVSMDDLLRWNELPNPDAISIGQNIQVKAPIDEASVGKDIILHVVAPSETVYAISRKYGMTVDEVMELNELSNFDLNVGQELKVYKKEE